MCSQIGVQDHERTNRAGDCLIRIFTVLGWSNTTRLKFECWTHGTICGPEPARGTTLMLLRNGWPRGGANGTKGLRYNMHSRGNPSARKRSLKCALPLRSLCQRKPTAWWKHRSWRMQGAKHKWANQ